MAHGALALHPFINSPSSLLPPNLLLPWTCCVLTLEVHSLSLPLEPEKEAEIAKINAEKEAAVSLIKEQSKTAQEVLSPPVQNLYDCE